ncbi:hypothetical protein PMZ80_005255 [Knufia obscura]|uniref:Major facilitator superfamily (MFS) profile domain-containing protein n=2 Tax=Knufia TaxID=430999 RepID=A0AAN8IS90_9EURO|nr:hypothetical protein PMZ80_005255 [Knufia obscura]KAK5957922.1 hypothetical protein OHC33_001112 [Knufia fluminis]
MTEKSVEEAAVANPIPKQHSLFRLVTDQARIDDDVLNYQYEGSGSASDPYVVTWIPDDAGNPMNWNKGLKWTIAMLVAFECFATAFSSSAFSGCLRELTAHFQASTTLLTAGISLFVLGFALGPLLWAPLSEMYGRQIIFFITFGCFTAFMGGATADSTLATLLVMRFFGGSFGSSPFTNAGGVIADIFSANERGAAMGIFALMPSLGPTTGPFISGFLGQSEGWRPVMGLMVALGGTLWVLGTLLVPETYAPVLLRKRAAELSKRTGKVYKTKVDIEKGEISAARTLGIALGRPFVLLFMEPIVLILSIYMSIVYGTLYLLFGAFPIVFQVERGWSEGVGGLAFLGVAVGMVIAIAIGGPLNKLYVKAGAKNGGVSPPEARLIGCMMGAIAFPIGMFWFAWTTPRSIHWISPVLAGVPFGFGLNLMFLGITNYLIDAYTIFAASVLAANTVLRSLFGAAFPLFTRDMYSSLGTQWASSVPAFLAVLMLPAPFVLYKYGAQIRSKCVYASEAEKAMAALRTKAAQTDTESEQPSRLHSIDSEKTDGSGTTATEPGKHEPIKSSGRARATSTAADPARLMKTTSRAESMGEAAAYEANPYDIDRVNTNASVAGVDLKRVWTNKSQR